MLLILANNLSTSNGKNCKNFKFDTKEKGEDIFSKIK